MRIPTSPKKGEKWAPPFCRGEDSIVGYGREEGKWPRLAQVRKSCGYLRIGEEGRGKSVGRGHVHEKSSRAQVKRAFPSTMSSTRNPPPKREPEAPTLNRHTPQTAYSICTSFPAPVARAAGCCGARQESKIETWCTQETVQCGAHDFSVRYSRRMSARV